MEAVGRFTIWDGALAGGVDGMGARLARLYVGLQLFGNQPSPLEDGDVLLDGGEAHRVVAGKLDDARVGSDRAAHDVAASVIGQRAEISPRDACRYRLRGEQLVRHAAAGPARRGANPQAN